MYVCAAAICFDQMRIRQNRNFLRPGAFMIGSARFLLVEGEAAAAAVLAAAAASASAERRGVSSASMALHRLFDL